MNKQKALGTYLTAAAAILALAAAIIYRKVMYTYTPVYYFLAAAVVLGCAAFFLAVPVPAAAGFIPVINAALCGCALVWGTSLMVNQLGYVVSGLDGMDTITSYIIFAAAAVIAMLLNIIAAFSPAAREA